MINKPLEGFSSEVFNCHDTQVCGVIASAAMIITMDTLVDLVVDISRIDLSTSLLIWCY